MKLSVLSSAVVLALLSTTTLAETKNDTEVMVVTATKGQTSLREAPASISVVTNEDLNRTPVNDVASALENVAGVHVVRTSSSEPSIVIRGLKNNNSSRDNYTLLLVNGRRINSNETMIRGAGFDFSSIPISAIDRIEVIRGPMSSLYGSDAIGGVVNVILKEPTEDTRINASVTYSQPEEGGGAMAKSNVFVSGAAVPSKLFYTVSAEVSQQDTWYPDDVASNNNFTGNAEQERAGAQTALTWLVNNQNKILFDLGYLKDDRTFPDSDENSTDDDDITNSEKITVGIGHQGEWRWGSNDINYLYENSQIYNENSNALLTVANAKQQNHSVDGKVAITAFEHQVLTTGFDVTHTAISIDRDYENTPSVTEQAVFIQDQIEITDNLTGTLSGRLTDHSAFGSDVTPRAYLVYSPTDRLTLKGGYAEGFKTPTIYQSSQNFSIVSCGGSCYLTGNPDLKAETSKTYEFATSYNADNWFVQATTFINHVENMIDRDTSTRSSGFITYKNIEDEVESKGIELEGKMDVTDDISVTANATYTRSLNTTDNSELENTPRWLSNMTLNWYATDRLSLFTSANYTGKQWGYSYSESNSIWYDPYIIANLGGSYAIDERWTVKAGITNFLDENLEADDQDYVESKVGRTYYITVDMAL